MPVRNRPALTRRSLLASPLLLGAAAPARPNIVFVMVDDLRWDELGCAGHPFASTPHCDRLAREGAAFRNAFAVTPLCSPSRATLLTGLYPHRHGIIDNTNRAAASHQLLTWPRRLRDSGYETAFLGKWHMGNDDSPRPGFDRWVSFRGQGECIDPELNLDGRTVKSSGYITDILTGHAVEFLERKRQQPFCLYLAHKAIHPNIQQRDDGSVTGSGEEENFIPAERHRNLYAGAKLPRRPNFAQPPAGKPALERRIGDLPPLGAATAPTDTAVLNRMRMMKAVDEGLGALLATLERTGQLDSTVVVLTSDHGYFYGEHGLHAERRLAYEETIRIPLLVRYPAAVRAGSRPAQFALTADIAPTMLDLARAPALATQGASLAPVLAGRNPKWRDRFLIEYYSDTVFPRIRNMGYRAVRGERWKYIHYRELEGADELYDLREDPFEQRNAIEDPRAAGALARARADLSRLNPERK